ncbi:all trans-polyprenyl-diphosphate synthase PDSS2-like [Pectinophora gossypiella]|uniref:all trans-polyprenyl-diphosphate synthase PDSS2-like n=1 Tax=Pectinophora gossypiella TaxID=13191 RepID=UPI00214F09C9|nr:all trans-polyprenyl-diphosphate synthase PDSS2-like [Pectinophora gossypiella]
MAMLAVSFAVSRVKKLPPFLFPNRFDSTDTSLTKEDTLILLKPPSTASTNWSNIIREAEKVVGYPTSFINLRQCLQSDDLANLTVYLKKLIGNNHFQPQTVKKILYGDSKNLQPWGLIILLLCKTVRSNSPQPQLDKIEEHQRQLAEVTEMIRAGHLIHKGIINIPFAKRSQTSETITFGNKIALLLGDCLLTTASSMLADLRNFDVYYTMHSALKDLSEGEFFGERDEQNMPLPGKPKKAKEDLDIPLDTMSISANDVLGKPRKEWTARSVFNGIRLLGRGCQSAMVLAKQSRETQTYAYHFGCHVGLAWQAATELQTLTSDNKDQFCLASAPVLFALEDNPDLYKIIDQGKNDVKDVDYEDLKFNILKTDAVEKTKMLYQDHARKATAYAESIGQNDSVDMIKKLINTF